jgi:uncharacterized membrane protein
MKEEKAKFSDKIPKRFMAAGFVFIAVLSLVKANPEWSHLSPRQLWHGGLFLLGAGIVATIFLHLPRMSNKEFEEEARKNGS